MSTSANIPKPAFVLVPRIEREFHSFQQWVNKAPTWLTKDAICVDAKGRVCRIGRDFMRARDEDAFPVKFFYEFDVQPEPTSPARAAMPPEAEKGWC